MLLDDYLTAAEIQAAEANANYLGVPNILLMESAGGAVADAVASRFKQGKSVLVVCGLGGNGGDGLVAARHLATRGYEVRVVLVGDPSLIRSEETMSNWEAAKQMRSSLHIKVISDSSEVEPLKADVVLDALIGYTYRGGLTPQVREMIRVVNSSKAFKVSVDLPTGMVADTGETPEEAVKADLTVTFHKPKTGFRNNPGQLGEFIVAPLGLPPEAELFAGPGDVRLVHREREPNSHKGMFGRLLVVGGSETYSGAPALTAMGAYAVGLDLVYVAVPETAAAAVAGFSPSMITVKLKGKRLSPDNHTQLVQFLDKVDAVAMGPGLGLEEETAREVMALLDEVEAKSLPVLIDADALKVCGQKKWRMKSPAIFTPHSKEFEVLTGEEAEGDYLEKGRRVEKEAKRLGSTILLKGQVDVVSDGRHTRYNWTGNPGMTVGGTGDVLSGITAGYIAQGASPLEAGVAGAFINGAAGDRVFAERGYHILPEDVVKKIPGVIEDAVAGRMRAR
jgi:hydroxyethylthiazole kinase-like uncharacterized protein yjeF